MVISNIIGGLGNQMFQYAAARSLAVAKGQSLYLDVSGFADYRLHNGFELSRIFDCKFELVTEHHLKQVLGWRSFQPVRRVLRRSQMAALRNEHFIVEPHFHYWPGFFDSPNDCYLVGYWQSEKYFKSIEKIIHREFTFNTPLAGINAHLATQISEGDTVSLHIRRGDFASNTKTKATHGLISLSYYKNVIERISHEIELPKFFVFSDDISWAKENLSMPYPCQFIGHNRGAESYIDMHLMSLCQHHIIANSSFSWWGAWLSSRPGKRVFFPAKWFANGSTNTSTLCPADWVRVE